MEGCAEEQESAVNQEDEETFKEAATEYRGSGESNGVQGVDESSKLVAVDGCEATPSAGLSEDPLLLLDDFRLEHKSLL